jgi:hypothetical protein
VSAQVILQDDGRNTKEDDEVESREGEGVGVGQQGEGGDERQKPALTESARRDREHAGSCSMHQGRTMVGLGRGGREAKEDAEWPRRRGGDWGRAGGKDGGGPRGGDSSCRS